MTEAEWLACENPNHALYLLRAVGSRCRRKDRLAAAAGLRQFWPDLSAEQRRAVTAAERYADGEIRFPELRAAAVRAGGGAGGTLPGAVARVTHREAADALWNATVLFLPVVAGGPVYTDPPFPEARAHAERGRPMMAILRCIFGNPYCPVAFSPQWRTDTALSLARQMYDSRDFSAMATLADALQDAGCDSKDILSHCRGPAPHVRGCWLVDLVVAKE
jgi:hypothetical protein